MSSTPKPFTTHEEQLEILMRRGMLVESKEDAIRFLERVNYYRLSGYWHLFRQEEDGALLDDFKSGTRFEDIVSLYNFDVSLRQATFCALSAIEVSIKKLLGYHLGEIDPLIYTYPNKLHPKALLLSKTPTKGNPNPPTEYKAWLKHYERNEFASRNQPFVVHNKDRYGKNLPIWVAVEVMTWGTMSHLYDISPDVVRDHVASRCGVSAPQLSSLLGALNYVRNICAHHDRFYNAGLRYPKDLCLDSSIVDTQGSQPGDTYYHLLMIQYLQKSLGVGDLSALPNVLREYPSVPSMPISSMGAPENWEDNSLWREEEREDKYRLLG